MSIDAIVKWVASLLTYHTTASKSSSKSQPSPLPQDLVSSKSAPLLKEFDEYFVWDKGVVAPLSPHFSTREMTCRCSFEECKEQRISKDLVQRLELVRTELRMPMRITSAFRCNAYQAHLRATGVNTVVAKKSTHELGDAVDAIPVSGMVDAFEPMCAKHFTSIGIASNFLHLDTRPGVRRWKY